MDAAARYRTTQAETAHPVRLMVLLFEHAVRLMRQARAHLEAGARSEASAALGRAIEIVSELSATFDSERAPELGEHLGDLYAFVNLRLLDADLKGDVQALEEAESVFAPVAEAFAEAARGVEKGTP